MSLLGAPNNAGARAALIANMAAAAASVGADGALDPNPAPTSHAPPAKARDSDLPAAGLWRSDGTVCEGATAGGPAAALFVPRPPANIHHALKRQRRLLSPKDVPRLWTLPRIAAELILALADQAVREERRARDPNHSPSYSPAPGNAHEPGARVHIAAVAYAGDGPVVPFATGASEARDRVDNPTTVLLAPEAALGLLRVLDTPPARSGRACDGTSASAAASAVPAQGYEPAGSAPRPADASAPSPADAPSSIDSAGTSSQPRSAAAAGAAAAGSTNPLGSAPLVGAGETLHANPAAASGHGTGGAGVAEQLARLVRGGIGAADIAAADALVLEVRA